MKKILFVSLCLLFVAGTAVAHWVPEDGHKMHYPQLPDPDGWDVLATQPKILADDWQCSSSGFVTDIHFWGSWKEDQMGTITNAHLSIHADDRTGAYSKPGDLLWSWDVEPTLIGDEPISWQGWFNPNTGEYVENDHQLWFIYNIVNIPAPFLQEKDTIYWLDISVTTVDGLWGWKTSESPQFEDDAVYSDDGVNWYELVDPITYESLDLAFVITPEPATIILLGIGGMLFRRRKH